MCLLCSFHVNHLNIPCSWWWKRVRRTHSLITWIDQECHLIDSQTTSEMTVINQSMKPLLCVISSLPVLEVLNFVPLWFEKEFSENYIRRFHFTSSFHLSQVHNSQIKQYYFLLFHIFFLTVHTWIEDWDSHHGFLIVLKDLQDGSYVQYLHICMLIIDMNYDSGMKSSSLCCLC